MVVVAAALIWRFDGFSRRYPRLRRSSFQCAALLTAASFAADAAAATAARLRRWPVAHCGWCEPRWGDLDFARHD